MTACKHAVVARHVEARRRDQGAEAGQEVPVVMSANAAPRRELAPAYWEEMLKQEGAQQRLAANVYRAVALGEHSEDA